MILEDGLVRFDHGPKENFTRPAADPLFRSAAAADGDRVGHAAETRVRVLKAFDGLAALLARAESLDMDVGSQRELLRQLRAEWESAV